MIKNYLLECADSYGEKHYEAKEIDTESGTVKLYKIGIGSGNDFPYSEFLTTANEMGYNGAEDVIKHYEELGSLGHEVPHDRQRAEEIGGLLRLARFRHETNRKLLNIPDNLKKYYGLSEEYTNKIIDYITNHNIERHIIKVFKEDGDSFITEINGTVGKILNNYTDKIEFIA